MAEPKKCPDCGTEMKREKPSRMFMGSDVWVCPKCRRAVNAEGEKDSN